MSIVSTDYYLNTYKGTPASSTAELQKLIDRAEDIVETKAVSNLSYKTVSKWYKKAICAQVEFMVNGADMILAGVSAQVDSASLGDFSFSLKSESGTSKSEGYAPLMFEYLTHGGFQDGLLGGCV